MTSPSKLEYRRLRAPREDGELFVEPAFEDFAHLLGQNLELLQQVPADFHGKSRQSLSAEARDELLDRAMAYTRAYRNVKSETRSRPIILSGHQPQLFHAGVWAKNFALHHLARRYDAVAVNLIIDNDLCRSTSVRVPAGKLTSPHVELIPFDRVQQPLPYEERSIRDAACFDSFGQRLAGAVTSLLPSPLGTKMWPWAVAASRRHANLGACVAEARHRLEESWGLDTLEVPLSHICETNSFRWFALHVLARLPEFHDEYNAVLDEYRRLHRLRSPAHPVPNLGNDGSWLEAPFWVWTTASPTRRPLSIRREQDRLYLSDGESESWSLDLAADRLNCGVEQLERYSRDGLRLRPRALVTTMFARIFLGDVFIHGIGGAKYDQTTDQLILRLFGARPPGFVTLSATLRLPLDAPQVGLADITKLTQLLRDIRFHPERHLQGADADQVSRWIAEKKRWIHANLPRGQRRARHIGITSANEALQHFLLEKREKIRALRSQAETQAAVAKTLGSREWSFCLFAEDDLRPRLLELFDTPA